MKPITIQAGDYDKLKSNIEAVAPILEKKYNLEFLDLSRVDAQPIFLVKDNLDFLNFYKTELVQSREQGQHYYKILL